MDNRSTKTSIGRRAFQPTEDDRLKVARMCAYGIPQFQIATIFGIAPKTLRKHFPKELTESAIEANFKVADTLFKMATSGRHVAASIFWAKTRNGFKVNSLELKPPKEKPETPPAPPSRIVVIRDDSSPILTD